MSVQYRSLFFNAPRSALFAALYEIARGINGLSFNRDDRIARLYLYRASFIIAIDTRDYA